MSNIHLSELPCAALNNANTQLASSSDLIEVD